MIVNISIQYSPILRKAIAQTSLDFQGLRAMNPGAGDAVYDDFVLTEDNIPEAYRQIANAAAVLGRALAPYLVKEESSAERVEYGIEISSGFNRNRLCRFADEYFICSLLEWWYGNRQEALRLRNADLAAAALRGIKEQVASTHCERRLRFF